MAGKRITSHKASKSGKKTRNAKKSSGAVLLAETVPGGEELIASVENAAGMILAVTENRNWIEVFFGGDLMHTRTIDLPSGKMFNIFVEEIPHKTTVYEHPRTMIFFTDPCDLRISRDGDKVIVMGMQ